MLSARSQPPETHASAASSQGCHALRNASAVSRRAAGPLVQQARTSVSKSGSSRLITRASIVEHFADVPHERVRQRQLPHRMARQRAPELVPEAGRAQAGVVVIAKPAPIELAPGVRRARGLEGGEALWRRADARELAMQASGRGML